ncbi:hypothetical protein Tco_1022379 [Tanacetum coccineum]
MLVEKKYPLKKEILEKMINLKIEAEEERKEAKVFERILSKSKSFNSRNLRFEGNGYLRKGQKSKPKRQNRARERKERKEKSKSKPSQKVKVNKSQVKVNPGMRHWKEHRKPNPKT